MNIEYIKQIAKLLHFKFGKTAGKKAIKDIIETWDTVYGLGLTERETALLEDYMKILWTK